MTDLLDIQAARKRSVTAGDLSEATGPHAVIVGPGNLFAGLPGGEYAQAGLPPVGSPRRDWALSNTPYMESMWAAAIFKAISKQVALGFRIEDETDSALRIRRAQQIIIGYDGAYTTGLQRGLQDFLLTDFGMVLEVARVSNARGSRIAGLFHLDALRCMATGDPERPIVYQSLDGAYHLLSAEQVVRITDMPSPRGHMRGYGMCAASRAWPTILKLAAVEIYFREKITGSRNLAIHIINGISDQQLRDALSSSEEMRNARGFVLYKGSTLIPMIRPDAPAVVTIPLAEVPDGFDVDQERRDSYLRIANAIGVAVQDIQPLSGQGLGTGTQSVVLADAAEGYGLAAWRTAWEHVVTHFILPSSTTFHLATSNSREEQDKAAVLSTRAGAMKTLVEAGIVTAAQALNILVDSGDIDKAFLPQDVTEAGVVEDDEKVTMAAERPEPAEPLPPPAPQITAEKATPYEVESIIDRELAAAMEWVRLVVTDE